MSEKINKGSTTFRMQVQANDELLQYKILGEFKAETENKMRLEIGLEMNPEQIKDVYVKIKQLEEGGYSADFMGYNLRKDM